MAANNEGVNNKKTQHDFQNFGTPAIYPLVIERLSGNFTGHELNNSDFHKVMTALQSRCEVYGVGEVESSRFTVFVNWNTLAQDGTASENTGSPQVEFGDLDYLQAEILSATGIEVKVWHGKVVGSEIDFNMDC